MITRNQFSLRVTSMSSVTWYACVILGWPLILFGLFQVVTSPGIQLLPAFVVTAALAIGLELMPLVGGRGHDPQGVVMSTAFAMAVLFVWGVWPAVVIIALAAVIADVRVGKQWWKTVFNPGQYALSVAAAGLVMPFFEHTPTLDHPLWHLDGEDLGWMALAWVVYFVVNLALVAGVLAWSAPFTEILRDDFGHYATMSFAVLALSPLVTLAGQQEWALVPLLLVPLLLIYYVATQSLEREHAAGHDALTGLPNRATLRYEVDEALNSHHREGLGFALMLIDLDDFKTVNDTLGHQVGDALLTRIAERLSASLRPGDLVARLGGDEFAILVYDADHETARHVADAIQQAVGSAIHLPEMVLEVQLSIGVALCPQHGLDTATLLRHADVAMYRAKHGRTGVETYAPEYDDNNPSRLALFGELRRALDEDHLELHYQPKVHADGRTLGVEALLRWRHPEQGWIPPDRFIPIAERSGIMPALTARVVRLALQQMALWRADGEDVAVAINVSPTDLTGDSLLDLVAAELAAFDVPASSLTLEITERVMTGESGQVTATLDRLRAMGVRISLDDFGTGYSSLLRLNLLPVDEIKIDRAFVARMAETPQSAGIVRTMIALAHGIGVTAVAEGVETRSQVSALTAMGCDVLQGWLVAPPMPPEEVVRWLNAQRPASRRSLAG
ncbi:MAG: putative bifunctional diguanylate cyclase/phosphodiesterase [Jatrophihabitans sp.]|uniref:putative bifunctional diguanylate cyclase/phosphodiesterase n=1 Tax=Jatrophihabitans sp. TaxID=1932789 RepID=UPI003F80BC3E